ncbi:ABC transporter substrate-binding protein, partial [Streptomyces sp. NPDC001193]
MLLDRTTRMKPWRRVAATLSVAALGVGLLTGCGSDSADKDRKNESANAPAADGAFPVTVEHAFGSTTVKGAPKRVVSVGYTDDQTILAFGIKPVGMVDQYPNPAGQTPDINTQWPWVKDKWGATRPEVVMSNGDAGPNFEKIASLRPDLIIAVYSEIDQAGYDKLSKIAPTVGRTKTEKEPFSAPWQDNALHIAKALGKADEGRQMVQGIQDKLAAVKKAHPEFANQTAVALSWYKDQVNPFTTSDVRGQLLTGMGF